MLIRVIDWYNKLKIDCVFKTVQLDSLDKGFELALLRQIKY